MNTHRLYEIFIAPRAADPNAQNQEVVLNWLLVGSLGLALAAFTNTLVSSFVTHEAYLAPRLAVVLGVLGLFGFLLALSRSHRQPVVPPVVLVAIFFAAAVLVAYQWDIINPVGILLFSVVIVMAGILLGGRFSLYAALLTGLVLTVLVFGKAHHYWSPDLDWMDKPSRQTDVVNFTAIYAILALVSWLFNRQMEMALKRAKNSERALKRQRDLLEIKVEQRTRQLQAAQLGQIQEFYRFAELGHLSTALFHDMANHLASVSIDIKGLRQDPHSDISNRIQDNIGYIDQVVWRVRRQIQGQSEVERFNVMEEIAEIIKILSYHSRRAKVMIDLKGPAGRQALMYRGDLTRFRQIIINLLSNGIEAYQDAARTAKTQPVVAVAVDQLGRDLRITVSDRGKGIRRADQAKVFEPFYSTKDKGMGIGLFIVKQVTEKDFGGTINLTSSKAGTAFVVTMPLKRHGKASRGGKAAKV